MQCFKVNSSTLDKRLDPSPYSPTRTIALEKIKNTQCPKYCLKEVADFRRELVTNIPDDCTYIGLANIESNTGIYINSDSEKETISSAFRFYKGDVLFPKLRPYLNKVFLADFDGICSTEIHVLNAKKCSSEYLYSFLSSQVVVDQTSNLMTGNTLPRLQTEDVENLLIPIPSLSVQESIIDISKQAYEYKLKKEQEAENKLSDINSIILETLHIKFPEVAEKRCYSISSFDLRNNRMDTHYHQPKFSLLEEYLKNCDCNYRKIKDISYKISSGVTPLSGGDSYTDNSGIPFIRSGDINKYDIIDYTKTLFIKEDVHNKMLRSSQLEYDDVLIAIVGATIGQVAVYKDKKPANINQALALVRVDKSKILPEYLKIYLLSRFGQEELNRNKRPVARANLNLDEIGNINILLPDIEKQQIIVSDYYKILKQVDELKKEAKIEFEESKAKFEKMILGEK